MAFLSAQSLSALSLPVNCGGECRPGERGPGRIAGTTKLDGTPTPCRVFLHTADGTLVSYQRTGASGQYEFIGLPVGPYRLVIEDDRQAARRSKVEHVIL